MTPSGFADYIGRIEEREDELSPSIARMLAATLSDVRTKEGAEEAKALETGAPIPPLWHWAAFHPRTPMNEMAVDGHPKRGGFLPPVPLERRMWAGGRLVFHQGLSLGEQLHRRSEILKVEEKSGAAGPMILVTVGHEIFGEMGLAVTEEQDIVYVAMPEDYQPPKPRPAPPEPDVELRQVIDGLLLFRYSAATFNGHRIHYDLPYAVEVEKYPGLLVHAPLQATLLMSLACHYRKAPPARFRFRGVHPMFHFHDLRLLGVEDGNSALELCTAAPEGHQGLQARAEWD